MYDMDGKGELVVYRAAVVMRKRPSSAAQQRDNRIVVASKLEVGVAEEF